MKILKSFIAFLLISLFLTAPAWAADLLINTLEEPPGSFTDTSGKLTGISVDMVREIQSRVGNTDPIRVYPWARTYQNTLKRPNVVAFTATRTPERENKFHWITKVTRKKYTFFARKKTPITLTSLDDAKRLKAIGVLRSSVWEQQLTARGFTNLDPVATHELNLKKLMAGRFPAIYYASDAIFQHCRNPGIDCDAIYPVYTTPIVEAYIIMSKNGTSMALVNQWKTAADDIKQDKTFEKIAKKWARYVNRQNGFEAHYADGALNFWKKE